jgi:hypothetical protein
MQKVWDSTSLGLLKECPRKYQIAMIFKRSAEPNFHLIFGILYHGALEYYDHLRAKGQDYESSVRDTLRWTLISSWDYEHNTPWDTGNSYKNRETLVRTVLWYLDHFKEDPMKTVILTNGKPAVELSFKLYTGFKDYYLSGHLDRLASFGANIFILDRKTTKNQLNEDYFSQYSPNNQISLYAFAGRAIFPELKADLMIDAAKILVGGSEFARFPVHRSEEQLEEWLVGFKVLMKEYESYFVNDFFPMNDKACFLCKFKKVCNAPQSLKTDYINQLEHWDWNPEKPRGL